MGMTEESSSSQENKRQGNAAGGFVVVLTIIGFAIAYVNHTITNWKAAEAHLSEAYIVSPHAGSVRGEIPLGLLTQTLMGTPPLYEPKTGQSVAGLASLRLKQERYSRSSGRRNRGSWKTYNRELALAEPVQMGSVRLDRALISQGADELWQRFDPMKIGNRALLTLWPRGTSTGRHFYPSGSTSDYSGNERISYDVIYSNQTVTAIGKFAPDTALQRGLNLTPSPVLPSDFPALWPGEKTTEEILATLHHRLINALVAMGGVFFLVGWFALFMADLLLFSAQRSSGTKLAVTSLLASLAALVLWYIYPVTLIAIPGVFATFALAYAVSRALSPAQNQRTFLP